MPSKTLKPATLTLCLALSGTATAEQADNPFAVQALPEGYMVADAADDRGAPTHRKKTAPTVAAQPEGPNPATVKKKPKDVDAKCGEVKCGASGTR